MSENPPEETPVVDESTPIADDVAVEVVDDQAPPAEEPVAEEPPAEEPVAEEPPAEEPVADESPTAAIEAAINGPDSDNPAKQIEEPPADAPVVYDEVDPEEDPIAYDELYDDNGERNNEFGGNPNNPPAGARVDQD